MGKVKGKHRLDKFYHLAKEHGYRSRAAWKLVQLDAKFNILRSSRSVLDLCAAPGGWMQVAVERVPVGSFVIGVDLDPIRPVRGAVAIQDDITTPKCRSTIKRLMAENGCKAFDLVLHDGSPNVGGAWAKEATGQNALVIDSVKLASEVLAPKGTFITKIFRSQDYSAVVYCLKQLFEKVEVDKPLASRLASAEIYVIGLRYKAPAKIDPRLLDIKHLFERGKEAPKVIDVLRGTKQKRHRDGYEDGDTVLRKVSSAADFIWSDSPLDILGSVSTISFEDPASLPMKDHSLTTEEVKALCDDLRVIGKQDFKHLLKWRIHIRKALSPVKEAPASKESEPKIEEDEEEKVLNEMEELTNAIERKKKRAKKILAKRRAKDKARKALVVNSDSALENYTDLELFSLSSIKGKKDLVAMDNNEIDDEAGESGTSDSEKSESQDDDIDTDEERRRYDDRMEQLLEEAYEQYTIKKEGKTMQRKRAKKNADNELLEDGNDDEMIEADEDSDNELGDGDANPLVVPFAEEEPTEEEIAARWFSQDVFAEPEEDDAMKAFNSDDEMELDDPVGKQKKPKSKGIKIQPEGPKIQPEGPKKNVQNTVKQVQPSKAKEDFEIVPAPQTDSDSSSSDESDEDDPQTKAEILAYAKKMLNKKQREEMFDDAYNKYLHQDVAGLPKWFVDEEMKHNQPMKPITREEVNAMKAQFKEIDARPAKKVAQAKARKKRDTMRRLEKVRKKANTISDQADISDRSKNKMIASLYSKATNPKKPKKEYVVAKKGVQVKGGKGKVIVDRRMKKDARQHGMKKNKNKDGKGKGSKGKPKGKGPTSSGGKSGRKGNKAYK